MYSFGIYQLKRDLYSEDVICEPHGNHKAKAYSKIQKKMRKESKHNTKESYQESYHKWRGKEKGTEGYYKTAKKKNN